MNIQKIISFMLMFSLTIGFSILLSACDMKDTDGEYQKEIGEKVVNSGIDLETGEMRKETPCREEVCDISVVSTEEACDKILGFWNESERKCVDLTKQSEQNYTGSEEEACYSSGGMYTIEDGVGKCTIIPSDAGKVCYSASDCRSELCQVSSTTDTEGKCNTDNPFRGCGKFLSPEKKVVRLCK